MNWHLLIISLLTASIIISSGKNPFGNSTGPFILINFVPGGKSFFRRKTLREQVSESGKEMEVEDATTGEIVIDELEDMTYKDQTWVTIFHELIHAYHAMVGAEIYDSGFINFSILNNPYIDSGDRFYPLLSENALRSIPELIKTDGITDGDIKDIIVKAMKCGFWNILASTIDFSSSDNLTLTKLMQNEEFVKICIYLNATVLSQDPNRMNNLWSTGLEMLCIQGYVPIWVENRLYIVESRQNEHILRIRGGEDEHSSYRYHLVHVLNGIFQNLKDKVKTRIMD